MQRLLVQEWSLGRIVRAVDGRLVSRRIDVGAPKGVTTDTRDLQKGELFFALRGERFDGHEFVDDAIRAGACGVVVEDRSVLSDESAPAIVVDDCIAALGRLGHALFQQSRQNGLRSVAITGSNGKTTTKELAAALWGIDGKVWATPGNLNNHIGLPLTLCAIPLNCDHLIVEMGANHRGEISDLINQAPADQRIVTSIGKAHLEGFGSIAGVRKAKSEIFESGARATTAIVPHSERRELIPLNFPGNVFTFGTESGADIRVVSVESAPDDGLGQMHVRIDLGFDVWSLALPFVGSHNATNLAAAVATLVGSHSKFDRDEVQQALTDVELPGGRLRTVSVGPLEIMDDAYNANPSSMRASYRAFQQWCRNCERKTVAVIGDMHELGERAEQAHRSLAQLLTSGSTLSSVIFVGEFGPAMVDAADGASTTEVLAITELDDIVEWLREQGSARVFVKGSRANRLERIITKLDAHF